MQITIGKLLGLLIAIGSAVTMIAGAGGITTEVVQGCLALLLPLALIWLPDELGSLTGSVGRGGYINTETSPILISIAGWFFLVGLPVLLYSLR